MKARITKEEFASLPELFKKEYAATDDDDAVYQLKVDPVDGVTLADVSKLQAALNTERKIAVEAAKKLKAYDGLDPEAAREALGFKQKWESGEISDTAKERLAEKERQLAAKFEDQRKKLEAAINEEKAKYQATEGKLRSQLQDAVLGAAIEGAIASNSGIPALLRPVVASRASLQSTEDGRLVPVILDDKKQPLLSRKPGSLTEPMGVDEFVQSLRGNPDFLGAFKASGSSGSGSTKNNGPSGASKGGSKEIILTAEEARNPQRYRQAVEEAKANGATVKIQTD